MPQHKKTKTGFIVQLSPEHFDYSKKKAVHADDVNNLFPKLSYNYLLVTTLFLQKVIYCFHWRKST